MKNEKAVPSLRSRWSGVLSLALFGVLSASDASAVLHSSRVPTTVRGEVIRVTRETVWVQQGKNTYEFNRNDTNALFPKGISVGDKITVQYTLQVEKVSVGPSDTRERAGSVAPSATPYMDDRGFYEARQEPPQPGQQG